MVVIFNESSALAYLRDDADDKSNVSTENFELGFKAEDSVYRCAVLGILEEVIFNTNGRWTRVYKDYI